MMALRHKQDHLVCLYILRKGCGSIVTSALCFLAFDLVLECREANHSQFLQELFVSFLQFQRTRGLCRHFAWECYILC